MADNIFTRLGRLFQSNVIIRKRDDNKLVVRDLDYTQTALQSNFIERYNKMISVLYLLYHTYQEYLIVNKNHHTL